MGTAGGFESLLLGVRFLALGSYLCLFMESQARCSVGALIIRIGFWGFLIIIIV